MKYNYKTAQPYLACFVLLKRADDKYAFLLRSNTDWMNDHYAVVSGKVERDENALSAAIREAREEAGVVVAEKDLLFLHICHRKVTNDTLAWIDLFYEVTIWKGAPYNAEPESHSELAWFDLEHLPKNVVPSHRAAIQCIQAGKVYSEYGW